MNVTVKISPRGTITLPRALRQRFVLKADDLLICEDTPAGILLKPASVLPTELYGPKRLAEFEACNNRSIASVFPDRRAKK
jgi:AbrB family looped-hinge helix DNA binding protein